MLVIYGDDFLIEVPDYEEYCIYYNEYECDAFGNIVTDTSRTDTFDVGDIIIQTPFCKYTLKKIYFCYLYCDKLIQYIAKKRKKEKKDIFVDLKKVVSEDVANCELEIEVFEEKALKREEHIRNIRLAPQKEKFSDWFLKMAEVENEIWK